MSPSMPALFTIDIKMARSYDEPSFFLSAGARFTVIAASGKKNPLLVNAARMRCFDSFMALSGRPTISKHGILSEMSHSTVTAYPSTP